ncbi:hypothetical protein JNB11_04100 [Kocuria palustris]|nr:hypothetical protein [Kocuria palustris]
MSNKQNPVYPKKSFRRTLLQGTNLELADDGCDVVMYGVLAKYIDELVKGCIVDGKLQPNLVDEASESLAKQFQG